MRPIETVFNSSKLFQRKGRPLLKLCKLQQQWREVVGDLIADKSFPQMLDRGKLIIAVENAVWAQQLSFLKQEIKVRVEKVLNEELKDIKCVQQASVGKPMANPYEKKPALKLTEQELAKNRSRSLEEIFTSTWDKLIELKKNRSTS